MSPYVLNGPKSSTAMLHKPATTGSFSVFCQSVSAVCFDLQPWPGMVLSGQKFVVTPAPKFGSIHKQCTKSHESDGHV